MSSYPHVCTQHMYPFEAHHVPLPWWPLSFAVVYGASHILCAGCMACVCMGEHVCCGRAGVFDKRHATVYLHMCHLIRVSCTEDAGQWFCTCSPLAHLHAVVHTGCNSTQGYTTDRKACMRCPRSMYSDILLQHNVETKHVVRRQTCTRHICSAACTYICGHRSGCCLWLTVAISGCCSGRNMLFERCVFLWLTVAIWSLVYTHFRSCLESEYTTQFLLL